MLLSAQPFIKQANIKGKIYWWAKLIGRQKMLVGKHNLNLRTLDWLNFTLKSAVLNFFLLNQQMLMLAAKNVSRPKMLAGKNVSRQKYWWAKMLAGKNVGGQKC
jgi:hypothetical protein